MTRLFNHFQSSVGSKIVMALSGLGLVTHVSFHMLGKVVGSVPRISPGRLVELVFGWPESPSGYIATRSPFLTNCDIERRFPTSLRCRRLMEVDLRQMAISLTVEERPL